MRRKMEGAAFLRNRVEALCCQVHTVLTDNGMAFPDLPKMIRSSSFQDHTA